MDISGGDMHTINLFWAAAAAAAQELCNFLFDFLGMCYEHFCWIGPCPDYEWIQRFPDSNIRREQKVPQINQF